MWQLAKIRKALTSSKIQNKTFDYKWIIESILLNVFSFTVIINIFKIKYISNTVITSGAKWSSVISTKCICFSGMNGSLQATLIRCDCLSGWQYVGCLLDSEKSVSIM